MSEMNNFGEFEALVADQDSVVDQFEIPSECQDCPVISSLQDRISTLRHNKTGIMGFSGIVMDGMPDEIKSQMTAHFASDHQEELAEMGMSAEDAIVQMEQQSRKSFSETIDELDTTITALEKLAQDKLANCHGKFKMRAVRGEAEYTVQICGSRAMTSSENPVQAIVNIRNAKKD